MELSKGVVHDVRLCVVTIMPCSLVNGVYTCSSCLLTRNKLEDGGRGETTNGQTTFNLCLSPCVCVSRWVGLGPNRQAM